MGGAGEDAATPGRRRFGAIGWGAAAAAVAWAALLHHGLGPVPEHAPLRWYEPTGFLLGIDGLAGVRDRLPLAFLAGLLPAVALAAVALACSRSAAARSLSLISVVAAALFVFYGIAAPYPWKFFGWRGSGALWGTAICVGGSIAAPLLVEPWLRLRRGVQIVVYLPIALAVVALIRNATGTDESLKYSISPWPAVPVFGIEVGALFVAASYLGIAVATVAVAASHRWKRVAGIGLGLVLPLLGVSLGAALDLLPFRLGPGTLAALAGLCTAGVVIVTLYDGRGETAALRHRARVLGVAAALVATPLVLGEVLARIDYHVTREWRARAIIEALDAYADRETLYPDSLAELVQAGDIDSIPAPSIGFRWLSETAFRYQSFGSSFILEFEAPRWVECAYTPPYEDENGDDGADDALAEAWSCPSEPPELW